jgi:hypothetical protein
MQFKDLRELLILFLHPLNIKTEWTDTLRLYPLHIICQERFNILIDYVTRSIATIGKGSIAQFDSDLKKQISSDVLPVSSLTVKI